MNMNDFKDKLKLIYIVKTSCYYTEKDSFNSLATRFISKSSQVFIQNSEGPLT